MDFGAFFDKCKNHGKNRGSENRVFNLLETVGTIRLGYLCHLDSIDVKLCFLKNFGP